MYQALYRKYRPRSFSDVVGQEHITETLRHQVESGRTSHAYLFVGTRGTGKTTCAKILSRALNCEHPVDGNPCNCCPSCRGIEDGSILDVVEIDAASNNGVDSIRTIRDETVYTPASVKKRVYIIDEVHMLSVSAFNALLKILEEPPEHLVFILATTELRKIPATILSRCQHFSFKRIGTADIKRRLNYVANAEGLTLTDGAADMLARLADGSMRDCLSLFDQCIRSDVVDEQAVLDATGLIGSQNTRDIWNALISGDTGGALSVFKKVYSDGADPASVLSDLLSLVRDMMMLRIAPNSAETFLSGAVDMDTLSEMSGTAQLPQLLAVSETLQSALTSMSTARDKRTAAEVCIIKLSSMLNGTYTPPEAQIRPAAPAPVPKAVKPAPAPTVPVQKPVQSDIKPPVSKETEPSPPPPWEDSDIPPVDDSDAPPWDEDEPEDVITWAQPDEPEIEAPSEPEPAPTPTVSRVDSWWDEILKICSSEVQENPFRFLSDKINLVPELNGNSLILHAANDFVSLMISSPEVMSCVSKAASSVLGRNITVSLKKGIVNQELQTDKLNELSRFGNIKFE
jgi:DNA polymerase-3 subunit gamma/tau